MSSGLNERLADADDPDQVERILDEFNIDHHDADTSSVPSTDAVTLHDYYERYLDQRQNKSPPTIAQYKRTLPDFFDFLHQDGVERPDGVTTDSIDKYVQELKDRYDRDATIYTYTKNVRAFLNWLNTRNKCDSALINILSKDALGLTPEARDEALPTNDAKHIISNLREHRRGTAPHALLEFTWNGGTRIGDAYSSDLKDFDPDEGRIALRHRPNQGTRLKNGEIGDGTPGDGERNISLNDSAVEVLQLYIATDRPNVTDEHGRQPLFATTQGRAHRSTLRRWIYKATSCRWAPQTSCDGTCDPDSNVCSYSYSPHAVRRGAIVEQLSNGLRPSRASERFDVSISTLKRHYDPRSKEQRRQDRVDAVEKAWNTW